MKQYVKLKRDVVILVVSIFATLTVSAANHFTSFTKIDDGFPLICNSKPCEIFVSNDEQKGVLIALESLKKDIYGVCDNYPNINKVSKFKEIKGENSIIVGIYTSPLIQKLFKTNKLQETELKGKNEKFIIKSIDSPDKKGGKILIIAGSDKRGAIYGIYELSKQMGVSPWYWWADVPIAKHKNVYIRKGEYTDGEPAIHYRGIFLNDEAPCLTGWNTYTFGTQNGGHEFYGHVFELILRLRGNFMWPAMWCWAFYADDPQNSSLANDMGVIIGTSHHEPMARNHQEWSRHRKNYGAWNYDTNKKVLDKFFTEGITRMQGTEDVVTIGMRGDGDEALSPDADVKSLKNIIKNQRKIIEKVTHKPASKTPQVWALYKEVQEYYDKGLRVPDDVIMLLSDDNWGDIRRLPNKQEQKHPGGWGMYYHIDYVGSPRNSKWLNITPIQNMWEQLQMTYAYNVKKMWILNVGDLKPMEYPITFFMDMAWNPDKFNEYNLLQHTYNFCAEQFGKSEALEASKILNLYTKYNGRVTAELLDARTYNLENGEWKKVADDYMTLETRALRQYIHLPKEYKDAYKQLILFPVQAMSNLYQMYYAEAMNLKLYAENNPEANKWADKVDECFARDSALCYDYNHIMSGGKWNHMMDQKHIGYTSWNDNFPANIKPETHRIDGTDGMLGNYVFTSANKSGYIAMEAPHYFKAVSNPSTKWTVLSGLGRTMGAMILLPYTEASKGAQLSYKLSLPKEVNSVTVHIIVKSTLNFLNNGGHKYAINFDNGEDVEVNFNKNMNEKPENINTNFYPVVVRRVVEKKIKMNIKNTKDGFHILNFKPLDPGIALEKIVVDYGGYEKSYLFGNESHSKRKLASNEAVFESFKYKSRQSDKPLLAGCYPDPSICRAGKDYYLVNSSFSYFPGVPIWHSADLKHWDRLGFVLNRKSQLNLTDSINMRAGIYAPDISYNPRNKTFYMITTGVGNIGNFYVTTKNPKKGKWSDPIRLPDVGGIDPSIFFDNDGKAYIVNNNAPKEKAKYQGHRAIWIREFNWRDNLVLNNKKMIIDGGIDISKNPIWIEGPHLYHIGDKYYLMAAEGGTGDNHSEVIFKSDSPYGPFKPCETNPILTQRSISSNRLNPVTCTGHADLCQTTEGKWFAVFLGVRPYKNGHDIMGRETFIHSVKWMNDQPIILNKGEKLSYSLINNSSENKSAYKEQKLWDKKALAKDAFFIRTPMVNFYSINNEDKLILPLLLDSINAYGHPAAVLRWVDSWKFTAETSVNYTPKEESNMAGLVVFQNDECNICFGLSKSEGAKVLKLKIRSKGIQTENHTYNISKSDFKKVYLKVSTNIDDNQQEKGVKYIFSYKLSKTDSWTQIPIKVSADLLSSKTAGGFTGTAIGVYASN